MRVLITNRTLATRTGTETYVRDLALGLLSLGHSPVVYTPEPGALAQELRDATVPVVEDLAQLGEAPDLIHGHHLHETMTALLRFPGVPAAFFVHDWHAWHDAPPDFPRILRYVAVDRTRRDRLVLEHAIPAERVSILPNGVDAARFAPRAGALPPRPGRALVFSNYARKGARLRDLRLACERSGVELDVAGAGVGRLVAAPEALLPAYDLVFALGRSALEAMAVGAGVVVWGVEGLGGFVRPENFRRLQDCNFGRRALRPAGPAELEAEIARFDPEAARAVQVQVRQELGLDSLLQAHLRLYEGLLAEAREQRWDSAGELRAASRYLGACQPVAQARAQDRSAASRRLRRARRLLDLGWVALSLMVLGFGVGMVRGAARRGAWGLSLESVAACLLLLAAVQGLRLFLLDRAEALAAPRRG